MYFKMRMKFNMRNQKLSFVRCGFHKGFYNDGEPLKSLLDIDYSEFFKLPDNADDFPYWSADVLLCGSCQIFALALRNAFGYNAYIIEGNNKICFHAFCQIYRNKEWYYVDARGITTSFDEFMNVAKKFVSDEYTIRLINSEDIEDWEKDDYYDEGMAFADAIIKKYKECYTLD